MKMDLRTLDELGMLQPRLDEVAPYALLDRMAEAMRNLFALVQGEVPSLLEDDHHYEMCTKVLADYEQTRRR